MYGGVVHNIGLFGDLHVDFELNRATRQALSKFVKQVVGVSGPGGGLVEMCDACRRRNAVASVMRDSISVDAVMPK